MKEIDKEVKALQHELDSNKKFTSEEYLKISQRLTLLHQMIINKEHKAFWEAIEINKNQEGKLT